MRRLIQWPHRRVAIAAIALAALSVVSGCAGDSFVEGEACAENATIQGGYCECNAGHTWCSSDPDAFDCCPIGGADCGNAACDSGETWATCVADCPFVCGPDSVDVAIGATALDFEWREDARGFTADPLYLNVAGGISSLQLTVDGGIANTSIFGLRDRNTAWIADGASTESYPFIEATSFMSVSFPFNEALMPTGCVGIVPAAVDDPGTVGALHVVARAGRGNQLGVEGIIVGDTYILEDEVRDVLEVASEVYQAAGAPALNIVSIRTLEWPNTVIEVEGDEIYDLRAAGATNAEAVPVYFIDSFDEFDTLGFAGGIPGPNGIVQAPSAGVVVAVEAHLAADAENLEVQMFGETIAHELGHQLGLFHTTEDTGTEHDPIGDTPECDTSFDLDGDETLTAEECESAGGRNMMFWTAGEFSQDEMTATQSRLLSLSPISE